MPSNWGVEDDEDAESWDGDELEEDSDEDEEGVVENPEERKTIRLVEGQENEIFHGFKNSIVHDVKFNGTFKTFEAFFQRIVALVGGQKIPFINYVYRLKLDKDLALFRDNYSSMCVGLFKVLVPCKAPWVPLSLSRPRRLGPTHA